MADKHPYISGTAGIANAIGQLKKSFPSQVTADTLRKLGIAPNNESYVVNILRFIGALDEEGKRTATALATFSKHDKKEFEDSFSSMLKESYADLFSLHGDAAWRLGTDKLIAFFRTSDKTSDLVGRRQASTFQVLAGFAGHGELPPSKTSSGSTKTPARKPARLSKKGGSQVQVAASPGTSEPINQHSSTEQTPAVVASGSRDVGLTVRIEVNLPATGDQDTYDRIFRSIRENLLNGK